MTGSAPTAQGNVNGILRKILCVTFVVVANLATQCGSINAMGELEAGAVRKEVERARATAPREGEKEAREAASMNSYVAKSSPSEPKSINQTKTSDGKK